MTTSSASVLSVSRTGEFLKTEVPDWDDEVALTARFKVLSGQRSDWEPRFCFWRDLIIKVARHLGVCVVRASELKNVWFSQGGLTPLCMDQVLHEMHVQGDILLKGELTDPTSGRLYCLLRQAAQLVGVFRSFSLQDCMDDTLILQKLLQERAADIIKTLVTRNWTYSCVITMTKFQSLCNGSEESTVIFSYLCESRKAQYFSVRKKKFVEGIKLSLSSASVNTVTKLDCDSLHLMWTTEKLQQQVEMVNQQWETSRSMALASFKSGNKQAAYRHIRQAKLFAQKRAKCTSFLERVEEVLALIADAESTKKVSEAIQIGTNAIKENRITVEEVSAQLEELNECFIDQKQVIEALERMQLHSDTEDEDVEEEFRKLEMELADEMPDPQIRKSVSQDQATLDKASGFGQIESTQLLSQTRSMLNIESAQLE